MKITGNYYFLVGDNMNQRIKNYMYLVSLLKTYKNYVINPECFENHERYLKMFSHKYLLDELDERDIKYKFIDTKQFNDLRIEIDLFSI